MTNKNRIVAWIGISLLSGIFLMFLLGENCRAQTGLCDPDPCQGIPNAIAGTCTEIGGSCTGPGDYSCSCDPGYTWKDATHTCVQEQQGDMVQIPSGCFQMGDSFNEGAPHELPVHTVCVSAFEMDVHEVTNADYKACVDAGVCDPPVYSSSVSRPSYYGNSAYNNFPVIWVNWDQASEYCKWASKRLPTEAEWEKAARGGLAGNRYPWGNTISGTNANYCDSGDPWDNDTSEVGHYEPNGYGLYDMAGNVHEWVKDWYQDNYYTVSPLNDPQGPTGGVLRVLRGGSWVSEAFTLRVANRYYGDPNLEASAFGFRCAR